jgi:RNA polymerase sigma-70 factor (ECF subfamily)
MSVSARLRRHCRTGGIPRTDLGGEHDNGVMTDAEQLAAIADGQVQALRELHRRHAGCLTVRLTQRISDSTVVDEAVQDTFVVVWRKAHQYRGEGVVAAWLWGIAIRKAIDHLRSARLPHLERPQAVVSAEEAVLAGIGYGELGQALERLSPELMAVVQARILDGLSTREAARLLGIPTGTVKTRLMRAKRIMREQLA